MPPEWRPAFETCARLAEAPVRQMRSFVGELIEQVGRIPGHLASPDQNEALEINLVLEVTVDEGLTELVVQQMKRAIEGAGGTS